jgi:hypothetical protein
MNEINFPDYFPMLTRVMKHVCITYHWASQFVSFSIDICVYCTICD